MSLTISRRAAVLGLAGSAVAAAGPAFGQQDFPSKPIRILVGFGPGGVGDIVMRLYAQKMSEVLNTSVVVENRPGAYQMVAIRALQAAPPDGYTLYMASGSSLVQNPGVRVNPGYDPLKDFSMIGMIDTIPGIIIVNPGLPVQSVADLVAYSVANPGKLNYASAGIGSAAHLAMEVFMGATGAKMTHIPYKSDAEMVREVMAGTAHVTIMAAANCLPAIKAGTVRGIAITSPRRHPEIPNVPTLAETGNKLLSDLEPHTFHALVGPIGLPATIVAKLNDAVNKVSTMPDIATRMRGTLLLEPETSTPATFRSFVQKELVKWTELGKRVKIND